MSTANFSSSFDKFLAETSFAEADTESAEFSAGSPDENGTAKASGASALGEKNVGDVVLCARLRFARNLDEFPFPNRARATQRRQIFQKIVEAAATVPALNGAFVFETEKLSATQRDFLIERRFASPDLKGEGSGVIISRSRDIALMLNEEDHVRIQAFRDYDCGDDDVFDRAREIDRTLGERLHFAFSERLGFLTSCPTNTGTGMRFSEMLHLPALVTDTQLESITRAIEAVGLTIRGSFGEGSDTHACVFQISNDFTLGISEEDTVALVRRWTAKVCNCETAARERLLARDSFGTLDRIARAYGMLRYAVTLSAEESADLLSLLRLGCELGRFPQTARRRFDELLIETGRAHIACRATFRKKSCDKKRENLLRARLFRETLSTVRPPEPPEVK